MLVFVGGIAFSSLPASALAQPSEGNAAAPNDPHAEAVELMRRGLEQYKKRDFEGARVHFAKAWALEQHPAVAASLADAETRLGRYRDAAEHWSFYLRNAPPERDRTDGETGLAECRKHVARVDVAVEDKATVSIDGQSVGEAPLPAEIWLEPGAHSIEARFANGSVASQRVELAAGEAKNIALVRTTSERLTKEPLASTAVAPAPTQPRPPSVGSPAKQEASTSLRTPVLVGGTAFTAVALGFGFVYALKAQSASNDADSLSKKVQGRVTDQGHGELATNATACQYGGAAVSDDCHELSTRVDEAKKARSTAQVALIAGGILGAGTLAAYFLWPRSDRSSASLVIAPWLLAGSSGVVAEGSF